MPSELRPRIHRLEFFSDAVFAVAITIMVLDVNIPEVLAVRHVDQLFRQIAAELIIYAFSFLLVAIFWTNHHFIVFTLPHADRATLWLNTHALFWITLIPLVARFFGEQPMAPRAAASYAFVLMLCTASLSLLRLHASRISRNDLYQAVHARVFRKALLATVVWAASIPLAFVDVRLAWLCFLVVPTMFFLPVIRGPDAATAAREEPREGSAG